MAALAFTATAICVINGRPFVERFALCYRTVVLSCLSVCLSVSLSVTLVHCGQTVGWIKIPLGVEEGLIHSHIVLDGAPASLHVCCGQTGGWIKMPLGREVGLGPGDIVLDRDPTPPKTGTAAPTFRLDGLRCHLVRKYASAQATLLGTWKGTQLPHGKGHNSPHFWAHVYCGQTVAHLSYS